MSGFRWNQLGLVCALSTALGCGTDYKISEETRNFVLNPELVDLSGVGVGEISPFVIEATSTGGGSIEIMAIEIINIEGEYFESIDDPIPDLIESEGSTLLNFSYVPAYEGYHWGQIIVKTDLEENGERTIEVRGNAASPAVAMWPGVIDFGPVPVGEIATDDVFVANQGPIAIEVVGFESNNEFFAVTEDLPIRIESGDKRDFSVQYTAAAEGEQVGIVSAVLTGDVLAGHVELRANACSTASGDLYDQDDDGYSVCGTDCDDTTAAIHPGAIELCNETDDNCDGTVDEQTACYDDDGDGYTEWDGDCNDADESIHPGAEEDTTNGIDDDCDGTVDAGASDFDGDGYAEGGGDCNDYDASIYPGAPEVEDGLDNDCDGDADEGTLSYDDDGDGMTERDGDCDDTNDRICPIAPEIPDWLDNDCDGDVDEGTTYADDDLDGFSELGGDCDDASDTVHPAAVEVVGDGIDNNCDGVEL